MLDSRREICRPLSKICRELTDSSRREKPPHPSVLYRWIAHGLKARDGVRVKLEFLICGGAICTSREAVERFFAELTRRSGLVESSAPVSPKKRSKVSAELQSLGLK